jgi:hypothetical protein
MIARAGDKRWSELLTGIVGSAGEQSCSECLQRLCHRRPVEDAEHEPFFSCSSACSTCLHRRFTGKVRWPEWRGFRSAKNVPILRLDYGTVQSTLLGVWEATVKVFGSECATQLRISIDPGNRHALDNFCCALNLVVTGLQPSRGRWIDSLAAGGSLSGSSS